MAAVEWDVDVAVSDAQFEAFTAPEPAAADPADVAAQRVTAVLVVHDGAHWLPEAVAALAQQHRRPDALVVVDTGSRDGSVDLTRELHPDAIVTLAGTVGFGAAIDAGLAAVDAGDWVWLLHDDCAPAPDALQRLLECALSHAAGAVGPKSVGWHRSDQLMEVGVSVTGGGRRYTGLERLEIDQGQHDQIRKVLAAGSAGLLLRRAVWDELGGLDPTLRMFRDDLDLGWRMNCAGHSVVVCPAAVVRHAEAAAHGRRQLGVSARGAHLLDRRNALYLVLANVPASRLPWAVLRLLVGGLLRALVLLLGKAPGLAADEVLALGDVLGHPGRLRRARAARRPFRRVRQAALKPLFPSLSRQVRASADAAAVLLAGSRPPEGPGERRVVDAGGGLDTETGPEDTRAVRRLLGRPSVVLVATLAVLALVAGRSLLGSGRLAGGALLPAPDRAADLLGSYLATWHPVSVGSPIGAPPYLALLGLLGLPLPGGASAAVSWLLLAAVPLAGWTAWIAVRRLVRATWARLLAAVTWSLVPVVTGAVAAGRLGTVIVAVLLPLIARSVVAALGRPDVPGPLRPAWTAGLLLAVGCAVAPVVWFPVAALGTLAAAISRSRAWAVRVAIVILTPPALLLPWTAQLVRSPGLLLTEAGLPGPGLADPQLPAWQLALLHAGGPGAAPWWLLSALAVAAVAALLSRHRRRLVVVAWAATFAGLATAAVLLRVPLTVPSLQGPLAGWPGPGIVLAAFAMVVAAVVGAERAARVLPAAAFSWRQAAAGAIGAAAALSLIIGTGWWIVGGEAGPLARQPATTLPAYVAQEATGPDKPRTLVLRPAQDVVGYTLVRGPGLVLGDSETSPTAAASAPLDRVVGDLLSGRGGDEVEDLTRFGVRYVYLPEPVDPTFAERLDGLAGLTRASAPDGGAVWRLEGISARVTLRSADGGVQPVPSGTVDVTAAVPPDVSPRLLVLAESADPGWHATLGGEPLVPQPVDGWAQGFRVPAGVGGLLTVEHRDPARGVWLALQGAAWLVVVALALPAMRRTGAVDDVAPDPDPEPAPPPGPVVAPDGQEPS